MQLTPKQAWTARNKEKIKAKAAAYYQRRKNDPVFTEKRSEAMKRFKQSPSYKKYNDEKNAARRGTEKSKFWSKKTQLKKYGITPEQYDAMVVAQHNLCAICGNPPRPKGFRLGVDHCHITKKVRGLLCLPCNHAMGIFKDNIEHLKSAVAYLEKHSGPH